MTLKENQTEEASQIHRPYCWECKGKNIFKKAHIDTTFFQAILILSVKNVCSEVVITQPCPWVPPYSLPSALWLVYSDFWCSKDGQEDSGGDIFSIHWTWHLEFSSCLCQAFLFTLFFHVKAEYLHLPHTDIVISFVSLLSIHHQ